jgi:anti-anti-sigma regulatory factor
MKRVPQRMPIILHARETIARAADLRETLVSRFAAGAALVVDGSRVEEIDTAILQLLTCAWRTAAERGVACGWDGASNALLRAATLIGVAELLHIPGADSTRASGDAAA